MQLSLATDNRKKVAVVSHERSGTHFLMNTIGANFGYLAEPWWNLDYEVPINFYVPKNIENYFRQAHDQAIANIVKSHHEAGFFEDCIDYLGSQFHIFYIYRDPRDALVSNWKLVNKLVWEEGPKTETVGEFLRAQPSGAMMRYQKQQHPNMLQRWKHHVKGWLDLAEQHPQLTIHSLKYEDLNLDFDNTVKMIGERLGMPIQQTNRPAKDKSVIVAGKGEVASYMEYFTDDDKAFVEQEIGDYLRTLGYQ